MTENEARDQGNEEIRNEAIEKTPGKEGMPQAKVEGARMVNARKFTLAAVFVAVIISLAFDSGLGTPSSFGIGQFFLLCPLGGIEAMIASKAFIPVSAISMAVVLVITLVFGRAWCAWGCPASVIRTFFKRQPKPASPNSKRAEGCEGDGEGTDAGGVEIVEDAGVKESGAMCPGVASAWSLSKSLAHIGKDKRTWVLVAVIAGTLIAGLPLFCLICPIGLTFGTVGSLWHLIVDKQMTLSVIVFPLALVVELVLYRRWCLDLCPIAGLLNIIGQFALRFRPDIDKEKCLRYTDGVDCQVCAHACSEFIDQHASDSVQQLGECTRCGECAKQCPAAAIKIKL